MRVSLKNIGYYECKLKFHQLPKTNLLYPIYFFKLIILNIQKPFKNKFLNKIQDWKILECNLTLEYSKKYLIVGTENEINVFKKILLNKVKPSKGSIIRNLICANFSSEKQFLLKKTIFLISYQEYIKISSHFENLNSNSLVILSSKDKEIEGFDKFKFYYKRLIKV